MAPSVRTCMTLAGLQARHPDRHIWRSPGGRYYAARKTPAGADGPMTLSGDTIEQLADRLARDGEA